MAIRHAVANGNWTNTATWNGGTLPDIGDDVYANGFSISINQNINVSKISTEICPNTLIGGGSFGSTPNTTLICDIISGTTLCLNCNNNLGTNLTIIGNVVANNASAIALIASAYITQLTGNVHGGLVANAFGIQTTNGLQVNNIIGNLISNVGVAYASSGTNNDSIIGNIYASPSAVGVQNNGGFLLTGNLFNNNGYLAVRSQRVYINTNDQIKWLVQNQSFQDIQLYSSDYFVDVPVETDVRKGITYGVGNSLTGSLEVPSSSSVAVGVPVDNTVGTAIINVQDMGALLASYII
jgi:hypothetical protein